MMSLSASQPPDWTYQKENYGDNTLDDARLSMWCPLDNGRALGPPLQSAGHLDRLPFELVTSILLQLNIPTITGLRRVNRRLRELVDAIPEYQKIWENCPDVLRAVVSLEAQEYSCERLYQTLSTTKCSICSSFGAYLYLITCQRVCRRCYTQDWDHWPLLAADAAYESRLEESQLGRFPKVNAAPGRYSSRSSSDYYCLPSRTALYDRAAVWAYAESQGIKPMRRKGCKRPPPKDPLRYMAIISAPYFDLSTKTAKWGVYCVGCQRYSLSSRIAYTEPGFAEHLKEYGAVITDVENRPCHANRLPPPSYVR